MPKTSERMQECAIAKTLLMHCRRALVPAATMAGGEGGGHLQRLLHQRCSRQRACHAGLVARLEACPCAAAVRCIQLRDTLVDALASVLKRQDAEGLLYLQRACQRGKL